MHRVLVRAVAVVALTILAAGTWFSVPANAALIHESATLGATGQGGGVSVDSGQFLGSRFSVSSTTNVTGIGGHLRSSQIIGNNLIFGAIITLSSPVALPTGSPLDIGEVLAFAAFNPGDPSSDVLVPLAVTLAAGDYALVFGSSELFGATGNGGMPSNNAEISGSASYFFYNGTDWLDGGFSNARFTVDAEVSPVPLPAGLPLFLSALVGFGLIGYRRRRQVVA